MRLQVAQQRVYNSTFHEVGGRWGGGGGRQPTKCGGWIKGAGEAKRDN